MSSKDEQKYYQFDFNNTRRIETVSMLSMLFIERSKVKKLPRLFAWGHSPNPGLLPCLVSQLAELFTGWGRSWTEDSGTPSRVRPY